MRPRDEFIHVNGLCLFQPTLLFASSTQRLQVLSFIPHHSFHPLVFFYSPLWPSSILVFAIGACLVGCSFVAMRWSLSQHDSEPRVYVHDHDADNGRSYFLVVGEVALALSYPILWYRMYTVGVAGELS